MKKTLFGCVLVLLVAAGCSKDPVANLSEDESRIYITNYDTSANFSNYKTFTIADSVAIVNNDHLQSKERTDYDVQLINEVASTLEQRGYTRVPNGQDADLGVALSVVTNTSTGLIQYGGYGGFYDDYFDPYYWGYPGYDYYFPPYYGTYQISENALSIDIFDLKDGHQNNELKSVWSGLVRGEGVFKNGNISTQVQSLFSQSPYLKNS